MSDYLKKFVVCGVGASLLFAGVMWKIQDNLMYLPQVPVQDQDDNPPRYRSPEERPLLRHYKNVTIEGADRPTLKGWFIRAPNNLSTRTIVFMHENAGNIGLRMDYFEKLIESLDVNILTIAYRGFSQSEGTPTEQGIKQDGLDIMKWV
jgi:hypothetical protein